MTHQRHVDQPVAWMQQTELLAKGFQRYRAALDALAPESRRPLVIKPNFHRYLTFFTPLDGWGTVADAHLGFMLTNEVNSFGQGLEKLVAWSSVLTAVDVDERHELLLEFVMPLAVHLLNLPFAIKNRFSFAAMRLSDEANWLRNSEPQNLERTSDDMTAPNWKSLWRYVKPWTSCTRVEEVVNSICPHGRHRLSRVETYRDRFVHRASRTTSDWEFWRRLRSSGMNVAGPQRPAICNRSTFSRSSGS